MFDKQKMWKLIQSDKFLQTTWARKEKNREINEANRDQWIRWFYDNYISDITFMINLYNSVVVEA